ncbi:MAG: PKD domain-containing protein [Bacteroidetes bacterium]|nr:PKD domain-containing protein [Bacteroidota bacterium]
MKKDIRILLVLLFLSFQSLVSANIVIVKGTIKDSSNFYLANRLVKIYSTDSTNGGCIISHNVYTNPNGHYIDTLRCTSGDIRKLYIIVENCDGTKLTRDPAVTATGVVEVNFIVCARPNIPPPIPGCKAVFAFTTNDSLAQFNSKESHAGSIPGAVHDSIISRTWNFGDSTVVLTGNRIDPNHIYKKAGKYLVTLTIKTKSGCESSYQLLIEIKLHVIATNCKAFFTSIVTDSIAKFNSTGSQASVYPGIAADSIVSRTWYFMDNYPNIATLTGNRVDPSYIYKQPGTYQVYLVIKTKLGCESKFTAPVTIKAPAPPTTCKASFTKTITDGLVKFKSADSKAASDSDVIVSRYWIFGETTSVAGVLQGNIIDPNHTYAKPGKYIVLLYIKTRSGCESKYADTIIISKVVCTAKASFSTEKISLKKVLFNSNLSTVQPGDSIIQRTWKFGDNTYIQGNTIKLEREYPTQGIYTACLQIVTLNGCKADTCKQVIVQDTANVPTVPNDYIKILAINPNPVIYNFRATIFSSAKDIECEIDVYDIYGMLKSTMKKLLAKGNNIVEVQTANLYHGPYFLRVISKSGKDSKIFYKL